MKICFIGHRNICADEKLVSILKETILNLIKNGATTFIFGSKSSFDNLAWEIVTELKLKFKNVKRVYVRAGNKIINKDYETYLHNFYEETYFPAKLENAGKYSYVERNYEMIEISDICVFYYDKNHLPLKRKSGTKIAYEYALIKNKQIINLGNV